MHRLSVDVRSCGISKRLEGPKELANLEISGCKSVEKLHNLGELKLLSLLYVQDCEKKLRVRRVNCCMQIIECESIKTLLDLWKLKKLMIQLDVSGCEELMRMTNAH